MAGVGGCWRVLVGVGGCWWVLVGVGGCWQVLAGVGRRWHGIDVSLKIIVEFSLKIGCPPPLLPSTPILL